VGNHTRHRYKVPFIIKEKSKHVASYPLGFWEKRPMTVSQPPLKVSEGMISVGSVNEASLASASNFFDGVHFENLSFFKDSYFIVHAFGQGE
jgi:hypothetical protein